jgi:hypothetical protein
MKNLMTVEEAKGVCKDRRKWKEVISAYPKDNGRDVMYVCIVNQDEGLYEYNIHNIVEKQLSKSIVPQRSRGESLVYNKNMIL